ncbi:G8 domain-containing protein [Roseovarius aestuariivivens]|uniref:G8 domain-containing protein n=1 Tax=Roseovarius aestuariivivens TaxID=1888910 RepID=UPI00107FF0E5|nr:G8 domain-containing protein [Roseovarius aestuariivivens]
MFQLEYYFLGEEVQNLADIDFSTLPTAQVSTKSVDATGGGATTEPVSAIQATSMLSIQTAGSYTFYVTSVGDATLLIDGAVLNSVETEDGGLTLETFTTELSAGDHELDLRSLQNTNSPMLRLEWEGPDSDGQRSLLTNETFAGATHDAGTDQTSHDMLADPTTSGMHPDHTSQDGALAQPTTAEEIEAYVFAVMFEPDESGHDVHASNSGKAVEHSHVMALVPRSEATHIAISDGDWSDPSTWYEGRIPDADAKVLIPKGVSVRYDTESDAALFTVRVDGELSFATDTDTKILLDTMVVSGLGRLEIGTEVDPIQQGVSTDIVIVNNGDIDVNWDPTLVSRGVISHGSVEIHGQEKTEFLKVADAPMAGDRQITLAEIPDNWAVGDTLVLTGTHKQGWRWSHADQAVTHFESEDEEVTIESINGNVVTLTTALRFDHDTPRDDLAAYVANMSRSITFSSEDGDATAVNHRGHVMFMHNADVDVRYAAFDDLGRTDKSVAAFDVETLDNVTADSNVKGRYSLHFHKTGSSIENDPAMAVGNSVSGSPGWGFVHHSSHADFVGNVAFDVFGAAFAAEDGDETGLWSNNLAIRAEGIGYGDWTVKKSADVSRDDNGRTGDGFFFAGRLVEADNNVAANTTNGFVWMTRGPRTENLAENLHQPETAYGNKTVSVDKPAIQGFHDNEAFGTHSGIIVVKAGPNQGHDVRTVMDGFLNWETAQGTHLTYTGHYTLKDFDLIGTTSTIQFNEPGVGLQLGQNAVDVTVNGVKIEGFKTGIRFDGTTVSIPDADVGHVIIDAELLNNGTDTVGFKAARHSFISSDELVEGRLEFEWTGDASVPLSGQNIVFTGIKTDSIGSTGRGKNALEQQEIKWWDIGDLVRKDGFYQTADGRNVVIIEDFVADRATGDLLKLGHVLELEATEAEIVQRYGVQSKGLIDLDKNAPVAQDDAAVTKQNLAVAIDVLANDTDDTGIWVDGLTSPRNGDAVLQDDGKIMYTPHFGKSGEDSFSYWVTSGNGKFTKATVKVNVEAAEDVAEAGNDQPDSTASAVPATPSFMEVINPVDTSANTVPIDLSGELYDLDFEPDIVIDDASGATEGVHVGAINKWSQLGRELSAQGHKEKTGYVIYEKGSEISIQQGDGQLSTYSANYFTLQENRAGHGGERITDSAVSTALEFGDIVLDPASIQGTDYRDHFMGSKEDEHFIGLGRRDYFDAGGGDDTINGGAGNDYMKGGKGADRFYLTAGDGKDRIVDFSSADVLELADYLDEGKTVQESAFENSKGDLVISNGSDSVTLQGLSLDDLEWISIV